MKRDPCIKETQAERLVRLQHDMVSWASAVGMDQDDLMTVCGMTCSMILSQRSQHSFYEFVSMLNQSRNLIIKEG